MCEIGKKYRVYIYGMGREYNKLSSYLLLYKDKLDVLGVVTTQKPSISSIDGYSCISVDDIDKEAADYVIIAVAKWQEIMDILEKHGIGEEKIIRSHVFRYPRFDLEGYLKLKRSKVTILSNFCLGGIIYNVLGLKMLSPTINMFCQGKDYLKFLQNYSHYLKSEMIEHNKNNCTDEWDEGMFCSKGILDGEVVWFFNHDDYASHAIEKWNQRAKCVNMKNIAVIMIIYNDDDLQGFLNLKIDKKIGIYYKRTNTPREGGVIYCAQWNDAHERHERLFNWRAAANAYLCDGQDGISPVDWIKFLNGEKDYLRFQEE